MVIDMAKYIIEYKTYDYPYFYKYYGASKDDPYGTYKTFDTLTSARKKAMALIKSHEAIVCAIRGGVEKLVYITESGNFVSEDRDTRKWYHLNKDGTLGSIIKDIKKIDIIQSRWMDGRYVF